MKALGYSAEEKSWFCLSDFPELTFYWAKIEKKLVKYTVCQMVKDAMEKHKFKQRSRLESATRPPRHS